jgi:hypothetical protein
VGRRGRCKLDCQPCGEESARLPSGSSSNRNSAFQKFRLWAKGGVFDKIFEALSADAYFEYVIIVQAHIGSKLSVSESI